MDKHVTISVPVGHHVHVVAPGQPQVVPGVIHDPAAMGAKSMMDMALAEEAGETPAQEAKEQASGAEKREPVHNKSSNKKGAKPKATTRDVQARGRGRKE